ncbi:hypothetical protein ACFQ3R_05180 [Mesonia ostreae]|uniref:Right handed beta helix domain-containing protein n=1 Tax=Mesonia ostreae TaxID=861110 RepID=A0ABU2KKG7_9FLAO|nr:hypothetical protein [Mesonia ostreae]MDT0295205.1 hypothetical protein [Mesonia ostreae]
MRSIYGILLLCSVVFWSSCRKDFETTPSSGKLSFSKDTVYLDTVFTNIGSSTYNLTVHNKSDEDIRIPNIQLANGENSNYRLNVDGLPGKDFRDIDILANDSIFIFIETTANIEDLSQTENQFLYTDAIEFDTESNQQKVELVTLIQDAHFLYPEKFADGTTEALSFGFDDEGNEILIEGFVLDDTELNFTNEKPYVIYGYAAVPSNKTLNIDAGARVHFHRESGLIVAEDGSLHVNGTLSNDPEILENEVIFEGDRLEPAFSEVAGQWGAIWLTQGSTNNKINFATIKNASVGIRMDSNDGTNQPTLSIKNTKIYNSANVGLLARTGFIEGENLVINNSGQASLNLSYGGRYTFTNSTFVNYFSNGFRQFPAVLIENLLETQENILVSDLIEANFYNCIIYGNENLELLFSKSDEAAFNYKFENCLIRFNDFNNLYAENPAYDFSNPALFENTVINEDPVFKDVRENLLQIGEESAANSLANPSTATFEDIIGTVRGNNPDSGAYESVIFEE